MHADRRGGDAGRRERQHILGVLRETGWVLREPKRAAARLGMRRSALHWKKKKLGISGSEKCGPVGACARWRARGRWHLPFLPHAVLTHPLRGSGDAIPNVHGSRREMPIGSERLGQLGS
jgi:hypothetical protein